MLEKTLEENIICEGKEKLAEIKKIESYSGDIVVLTASTR